MVTDRLFRRLRKLIQTEDTLAQAADKAGVDEKTARKYRDSDPLPSQRRVPHTWRTREDPFQDVWPELVEQLRLNPGLQAKTLFDDLQRRHPGRFPDVQLRCLQRRIKRWRALEGPPKEVFFAQTHEPGRLAESDFTHMGDLGVTIAGEPFDHLVYHFVLTYSNWEAGTVCFSESFESLSEGLQNALWELGGVPRRHRTDRLTAAVNTDPQPEMFTRRYQALMTHYGLEAQAIQPRQANENGDVEQSHHRFKQAVDQALMLRGSRDFAGRGDYQTFLKKLMAGRNANRKGRFRRGNGRAVVPAGPPAGDGPPDQGTGRLGEHDPRRRQRLLAAQPTDRRVGGRSRQGRDPGGLARGQQGRHPASASWPGEASRRVPPRHRLAGAQARGVRGVPLPRRDVPDQPVPDRLRRVEGPAARPRGQGLPGDPPPGEPGRRGRGRRRPAAVARRRADARRRGRHGGAFAGPPAGGGDRGVDRGRGPEDVRPAPGAKGGT